MSPYKWRRMSVLPAILAGALAMGAGLPLPRDSTETYVGTETCRPCHRTAFETWVRSDHARSGLVFGMMMGREMMGKAMARQEHTGEAFECRACHAPPGASIVGRFGPCYHPEDGVQCETCHGPGGEHVRIETLKDTLAGHRIFVAKQRADLCQVCHYDEKPFHVREVLRTPPFDYESAWRRTAHPTPAEERSRR